MAIAFAPTQDGFVSDENGSSRTSSSSTSSSSASAPNRIDGQVAGFVSPSSSSSSSTASDTSQVSVPVTTCLLIIIGSVKRLPDSYDALTICNCFVRIQVHCDWRDDIPTGPADRMLFLFCVVEQHRFRRCDSRQSEQLTRFRCGGIFCSVIFSFSSVDSSSSRAT